MGLPDPLDYYEIEGHFDAASLAARDRVRAWVEAAVRPGLRNAHREGAFPLSWVRGLGEQRCFAPQLDAYGCLGLDSAGYGLIMQELERADSGLRSCASVQGALVMHAIHVYGSPEQRERWLPLLAAGERIAAFALTERGHGSDPGGMETVARPAEGGYALHGSKCWINNGSLADIVLVWAKDPGGHVGGYLVEKGVPGFRAENISGKFSLRASVTSELFFEECVIPGENRLPEARGLRAALSCLSQARFGIAWGVIGAAQDCFAHTLHYLRERVQFGRPLASMQLVQEKLVNMAQEITKAQALALQLARLKDAGRARPAQISLAKRNNVAMALECARTCRALLGGVGITDAFPVVRHMMNLETVQTYEGTHDVHTLIVGHDLTGHAAYGG